MQGKRIIILIVLFFALAVRSVNAEEMSAMALPTPTPVDYALPYPGILPGHPFYFLKTIRDNMLGFLVSGVFKKAEFNLLQADKHIASAQSLFAQKKENPQVLSSLDKAVDYFGNAISKAEEAKKQGMDNQDFVQKLSLANLKHQEVVASMIQTTKGDTKKLLTNELKKVKELGKKAQALQRK